MFKTHTDLWDEAQRLIKDEIGASRFDLWFGEITSLGFENNVLRVLVPSAFFVEYIEDNFLGVLGAAINKVYGPDVQLHYNYNVVARQPDTAVDVKSQPYSSNDNSTPASNAEFQTPVANDFKSHLNSRYNFSTYCCSKSNKDACAIATTIANDPRVKTFNPLFLFGPTGVGKTHLIQAIGLRIKELNPQTRVLYVTARDFESQFTTASLKGQKNNFFNFYQSIHTLIVDDIQDLNNRPKSQNTFFNIFNHLHLNSRQIILSSDRAPSQMEGFEDRLLGRFKWGISLGIDKPDIALRRQVLKQKSENAGLVLPPVVVEYIVENVTESVRELEGIMASLVTHATVFNKPISLDLAKMVVSNAVKTAKPQIDFEIVAQLVAEHYGLNPDLLFTKSRKREISDARQVAMYLARKVSDMPVTAIGHRLGRSHATVIYAINHIAERIVLEKPFADAVAAIQVALQH